MAKEPKATAASLIPEGAGLADLRQIAGACTACPLWERGSQTVFGAGAERAAIMLVGQQPGNEEDVAGHPFVGPAGPLLDAALSEAGVDRGLTYVTNVVKHFKWEPRGKRRIHAKPNAAEISACLPWLQNEIRVVQPRLVVCLGATAAQSLLGRMFKVTQQRGKVLREIGWAEAAMATWHPSAVLRAPDPAARARQTAELVEDLRVAREYLARAE